MDLVSEEWTIELLARDTRRQLAQLTTDVAAAGRLPTVTEDLFLWKTFPKLTDYRIIAEPTNAYNCVGWTVARDKSVHVWPPEIFPGNPHRAMNVFYQCLGLTRSDRPAADPHARTVALFEKNHLPSHVALRAETSDAWESKIGRRWCIRHTLAELEGEYYGTVVCFFS